MLRLVNIDDIEPSTYNPRKADPRRLEILELSIRKLGFVLPLFCSQNGEILSGHQRHHVSKIMGIDKVPVVYTGPMDLADRKAINIAFNRGTNDLRPEDTPDNITDALSRVDLIQLSQGIDDKSGKALYRCMHTTKESVSELVKINRGHWINYSRNMARLLHGKGIDMPLVCTPDKQVVNGIGRLQYFAEKGFEHIDVVYINEAEAKLSDAMLNLLSMDFDIHSRYEELLRYNSFRRARRQRSELGQGFVFAVAPNARSKEFDILEPKNSKKWKLQHGTSVVDFGAGHLTETNLLRSVGVSVSPFEPFRLGENDTINIQESIEIAKAFIHDIKSRKSYTSIFISSVLNSVPFERDRQHIACLCAALCSEKTRLYACAVSVDCTSYRFVEGADGLGQRESKYATFKLDYESGITIGDFKEKPKVQKYHSPSEFYALFKRYFDIVKVDNKLNNVRAICAKPNRVHILRDLKAAIEFEFNLPYPDGSRMELVDEALEAYSHRLGVSL
ncbi:ParB N-terminal domain-containing protein [Vibrio diazotrophicus]|uniref:ParB N-terminal domain-containing protein n=1 Tax=Vibrio diazotrophicus TaxID=685 RepID=UPI00142E797F|nr:ParB N-terminal domain-containing protein [Vibrio diazotrophicus]NIY91114.1 ParB N-terminal domain-containing protein [Vibrio diazotrophicus]